MLKVDISGQQDIETKTWVCYQIFVTEASHPDQPKIIFGALLAVRWCKAYDLVSI